MNHRTDGFGKYMVAWRWEMQVDQETMRHTPVARMGWAYWLYFDDEAAAKAFMATYVPQHFPDDPPNLIHSSFSREDFFAG